MTHTHPNPPERVGFFFGFLSLTLLTQRIFCGKMDTDD